MVKQANDAKLAEITGVISEVMSQTISSSSTTFNSSSSSYQINHNSTGCNNIKISETSVTYVASSTVLANSTTYQSVVATIVNKLTASQSQKAAGGLFTKQDNDTTAAIINLIHTKLDQETMASIGNDANTSESSVQVCDDANGGTNFYFNSQNDVFNYYNKVYSQSATVQSVAADIANTLQSDQAQKSTGLLAMLVRMVMLIVIAIIVIVVFVGVVYFGIM